MIFFSQTLRFYDEKRTGGNVSNMLRMFIAAVLCATALIGNVIPSAVAGPYPNGPITLVNPYAAGGPADVLARTIIDPLKDMLGQPIVLLNKPGGATAIAAAYVAAAPPDGQTVLLGGASSHIVTPALTKVGYDGMRDFDFICMVAAVPNVLVVRSGLPAATVPELVSLAKQMPGKLNYGSVGTGSQPHLAAELFRQRTGTNITHVPYKGAAPAIVDLLGGQIDLAFLNLPPLLPHIQSGALRALAVARLQRAEQLPNIPTLDELGYPGFDVTTWYGLSAPAGTPPEITSKLADTFATVLRSPDVKAKLASQGAEVFYLPPKQFVAYLADDASRLRQLVKTANITGE
jgi:tripartite-type tricarboxylate transporter receptor subunit TctC